MNGSDGNLDETLQHRQDLRQSLEQTFRILDRVLKQTEPRLDVREVGTVGYVGHGIVRASGMTAVQAKEVLRFPGNRLGIAFNTGRKEIGIVLLDESEDIGSGTEVERTGRVLDVPVGEALLGRVLDASGRPCDGRGPLHAGKRRPVERPAPGIMDRAPVTVPLQTGIKVIDALIPIGRGQRELILGDRKTGKTAIAIDTIINQKKKDVLCVYCGIGKRASSLAKVISELRKHDALDYSIIVLATEEDPPGLQFTAPYAATTMGEYFMDQGRDVLIVLDDLTRHARAYRELSLLLRRPPGREAYPGDIFYIHSRLLERYTHLKEDLNGGSLTALPIIETEAQNLSAYIPTNLISITDGQIYCSPSLFQKGNLPAVDVGKSVSRVGGKTQFPAYRDIAGDLRLSYSQFEELEAFSRFGTRLDEDTRRTLERGRRVREILKQEQYETMPAADQVVELLAVNRGLLDEKPVDEVLEDAKMMRREVRQAQPELCKKIERGGKPSGEEIDSLVNSAQQALKKRKNNGNH